MATDAEELLIQPFRDVVALANTAVSNAAAFANHDGKKAEQMMKAARSLAREGERGLNKVQTIWKSQLLIHGNVFRDRLLQQGNVAHTRFDLL